MKHHTHLNPPLVSISVILDNGSLRRGPERARWLDWQAGEEGEEGEEARLTGLSSGVSA